MMNALRPIRVTREDTDDEQPLSPMARMFHEPDSNVYIIAIMGFSTPINTDVFKANIAKFFHMHPRFSSLQVVDSRNEAKMKWVKAEVNIENHLICPIINPKMDSPDKFVEDYVSNLSKTTISNTIPMWDVHLLNVKTSEAESIAILRIHHSIGDGTSLMSLLLSSSRKVSDPNALPTIPTMKRRNLKVNSATTSTGGGIWKYFVKLWLSLILYWNTIVDAVMFLVTIFFLEDTKTPIKSTLKNGSSSRRFVHRSISLDDVKMVKNAMGTTINDVMVGVAQAGLSRYLNRKYGDLHKKDDKGSAKEYNNLPNNIRLRATFFVNIRPSSGIHALEDMTSKETKARWGNQIGYQLFPFTIALRDDPLDYIRDAKVTGQRKKATLEPKFTYLLAKFFLNFFGYKVGSFPTQTTLWFSNVPGPQEHISYHGHPVAFIAPSCYGQPNALMIHVVSYVDKIRIIMSANESIISDPHQLCDDLENSFKLIKDAVIDKLKEQWMIMEHN